MINSKKKNRRTILFLLFYCCLFFVNVTLFPEEKYTRRCEIKFSFTPLIGSHSNFKFGNLIPLPNTADVPPISTSLEHHRPVYGLAVGYQACKSVEIRLTAISGKSRIINHLGIGFTGIPLGDVTVSNSSLSLFGGEIFYILPLKKLSFYVCGGGGAAYLKTGKIGSKWRTFFEAGLGTQVNLTSNLKVFLDVREYLSFFKFDRDFQFAFPAIYTSNFKSSQTFTGFQGGLSYYF